MSAALYRRNTSESGRYAVSGSRCHAILPRLYTGYQLVYTSVLGCSRTAQHERGLFLSCLFLLTLMSAQAPGQTPALPAHLYRYDTASHLHSAAAYQGCSSGHQEWQGLAGAACRPPAAGRPQH